jgi:uncharacterized protein with ParB-like and HNH nuclease domain
LISFSDFFSGKALFRIPNYQRGYAWQEPQIKDFWEDLINLREGRTHYSGMITLQKLKKSSCKEWKEDQWFLDSKQSSLDSKQSSAYHVIDGQQRLTTFVILINSMVEYAEKSGFDSIDSFSLDTIRSKYLFKSNRFNTSFVFGYEVDNPSFDYLKYKIFGVKGQDLVAESYYTNNLGFAKEFFDRNLDSFCKGVSGKLDTLFRKLTTSIKFIKYLIDSNLNVFVAFETMNNRGRRLSTLELLKNRLIYLITLYPENVLKSYNKDYYTTLINSNWSTVYSNLGRNKDKPLDDDEFLRNHWILYFGYSRNTSNEFVKSLLNKHFTADAVLGKPPVLSEEVLTVQSDIDQEEGQIQNDYEESDSSVLTPDKIKDYVISLANVSTIWFYTFNPRAINSPFTSEEILAIERLNRLGIAYFRPLVVASILNKSVTVEQRLEMMECIERLILLIFRMARYMSTYQSTVYYRHAHDLCSQNIIDNVIYDLKKLFLSNLETGVKSFKDKMMAAYDNEDGFYRWNSIRYLLYEYEIHLSEDKHAPRVDWATFNQFNRDMVSIEHIYPQTHDNDTDWPEFSHLDETTKKHYLNSLGNLLLLKTPINSGLQNSPFPVKKSGIGRTRGYKDGSMSEMKVAQYDTWGPEQIEERGLEMLKFIEERWLITFKDFRQKYEILGLEYNPSENDPVESHPSTSIDELTSKLLGSSSEQHVPSGLIIRPLKDVEETGQTVQGIRYGDVYYPGKAFNAALEVMKAIISTDPLKMDPYCDILVGRERNPRYTKKEPPTKHYYDASGIKIYIHMGSHAVKVLKNIIDIYDLDIDDFSVYFSNKN